MSVKEIPDWVPPSAKEIDAKMLVLKAERYKLTEEKSKALPMKQVSIDARLSMIKQEMELLKHVRQKTNEALNDQYVDIVRMGLGEPHQYIHKRILAEAASRAQGNPHQSVNIFPDDMIDALTENRRLVQQKQEADARIHKIVTVLEQSRLSMKGQMPMDEFDRRQAFNRLIDKLIHQINQK